MEASNFMICPKCRIIFDKDYNCNCDVFFGYIDEIDIEETIEYFRRRIFRAFDIPIESVVMSCHPLNHKTRVLSSWADFAENAGENVINEEIATFLTDQGIPITPEVENCGSTVWDLIIRVLEKYNYL